MCRSCLLVFLAGRGVGDLVLRGFGVEEFGCLGFRRAGLWSSGFGMCRFRHNQP